MMYFDDFERDEKKLELQIMDDLMCASWAVDDIDQTIKLESPKGPKLQTLLYDRQKYQENYDDAAVRYYKFLKGRLI